MNTQNLLNYQEEEIMSAQSKIRQSRAAWKHKAAVRANGSRDDRKTIRRQSRRIRQQNQELRVYKARIALLEATAAKPTVTFKVEVVLLALQFFVIARISQRAISRVLNVLSAFLGGFKSPCPQTVCNWVNKLSLSRLWAVPGVVKLSAPRALFTNGWMYIVDESIGHACEKILLVLGVRADHYAINTGHPSLHDMRPMAVAVSKSWTGETIAEFLQRIITVCGRPSGIIIDGGTNLRKAMVILNEHSINSPVIRDISHYLANILELKYGSDPRLESFLSACGDSAKRLKQSILACLIPPKVRTKARFMNLHRLIRWANRILALSPMGRASAGSMLEKLRKSITDLPRHRLFIERFLVDANTILACQKVLKQCGLNSESKAECRRLIRGRPDHDPIKQGIIQWLNEYIKVARQLGLEDTGMLVSSDAIESVFGISKNHGVAAIKDPARMALKIGSLCGGVSPDDARNVVMMSHSSLVKALPPRSLQSDRIAIFNGSKDLEAINNSNSNQQFCIIPRSRNRDDADIIDIKSIYCGDSTGPPRNRVDQAS